MGYSDIVPFSILLGKTLVSVKRKGDDEIIWKASDSSEYRMYHSQDCCESVDIEDICGELSDLIGAPVVLAEESSNSENPPPSEYGPPESFTWTFYRISAAKGTVVIRWYGTSNGYYSESVYFEQITPPTPRDNNEEQPHE